MTTYDVIVLGAGAMGSATLWALAQRGVRALGIEQHRIGHAFGASHGQSRLIRQAYFEHPDYVPLLKEVYGLWERIEREWGRPLFHKTGLVIFGEPHHPVIQGVERSSREHRIPIDRLLGNDAKSLHPSLGHVEGHIGLVEPAAGLLEVESCCIAMATLARNHGASIVEGEPVLDVCEEGHRVRVRTGAGVYFAAQLVICAGPWAAKFLPWLAPYLSVNRVPLYWFEGDANLRVSTGAPCFAYCMSDGFYYGFPALDERGVKVGLHKPGARLGRPEDVDRSDLAADRETIKAFAKRCLPSLPSDPKAHAVCLYTMTPDEHFILDSKGRTHFAAGFSGHGFKFAPVIGEIMADLALNGGTRRPISILRQRWSNL